MLLYLVYKWEYTDQCFSWDKWHLMIEWLLFKDLVFLMTSSKMYLIIFNVFSISYLVFVYLFVFFFIYKVHILWKSSGSLNFIKSECKLKWADKISKQIMCKKKEKTITFITEKRHNDTYSNWILKTQGTKDSVKFIFHESKLFMNKLMFTRMDDFFSE